MISKINFVNLFSIVFISACIALAAYNHGRPQKPQQQNTASTTRPAVKVRRFGMVTGLKAEKLVYYKKLHAHAWAAVLKKIQECNIRNYSIYLQKIEDKYFLFSYFEYVGVDFKVDMAKMAADTTTQRWWKETDPTQIPLPEAAAGKQQWQKMEEVFHTN